MKERVFGINRKVEVKRGGDVFRSVIQEVSEDEFLLLGDFEKRLCKGEEVSVVVFGPGERFEFSSLVRGFTSNGCLRLAKPSSEVRRVQLRSFVRAKCVLEVRWRIASPEEMEADFPGPADRRAVAADISGGGTLLALDERLSLGQILYLEFTIPLSKPHEVKVFAEVRRVYEGEFGGRKLFMTGVEFRGVRERDQDVIIAYVFRRLAEEKRVR